MPVPDITVVISSNSPALNEDQFRTLGRPYGERDCRRIDQARRNSGRVHRHDDGGVGVTEVRHWQSSSADRRVCQDVTARPGNSFRRPDRFFDGYFTLA
jgi:hypothetical protein